MVKRSQNRGLLTWLVATAAAGCTAIVGVDQDYQLDPRPGQGGSALTGGAGTGGVIVGGSGGSGGSGGTGGAAGKGASGGGTGGSGGSAGTGGSGGSGATGGATGVSGAGGASKGGTGGVSGSGGAGGIAGTSGTAGTGGSGGADSGTTGGSAGSGGTGGSGGGAGTGGAAGTSGGGAGASGTSGAAGSGGVGGSAIDAGDVSAGGAGGAPPDAGADGAPDVPPDMGSPCGPGTKFCGVCVATSDPNYGCAGPTCTPCELNGTATCMSGNCVVTGCNTGYHQVGNACVPNGPEVCNNNVDDDGDTRTDCFDTDCVSNPSCVGRCMDAAPIGCDTIVTGQNTSAAGSTSRISSYSCSAGTYNGSEFAYRFTGAAGQRVYAEIYGLSGGLGLFQIGAPTGQQCAATSCGAYGDAATTITGAEALGFDTVAGQDYYLVVDGAFSSRNYSLSVQCSTVDGCRPVKPIEAGQSFSVTNNPASGASNVTASKVPTYDCTGFGETGPEAAWIFTPTVTAMYRASVTMLTADCDLYILSGANCGGTCLSPTTYSAALNQAPESVIFQGVANTTYYIVVDGYFGAICNFTIGLTQCPTSGPCP
jgi:hypothetical protein